MILGPAARSALQAPGTAVPGAWTVASATRRYSNTGIFLEPLTSPESAHSVLFNAPAKGRLMELTKIAGNCKDGDCPTVYRTDRGTIAVQGDRLSHPTPDHEAIVEIPLALLAEAARALGG